MPDLKTAIPDLKKTAMPNLKTAMPDLKTAMPDLKTAMPDLKTAMPDLKTAMPNSQLHGVREKKMFHLCEICITKFVFCFEIKVSIANTVFLTLL